MSSESKQSKGEISYLSIARAKNPSGRTGCIGAVTKGRAPGKGPTGGGSKDVAPRASPTANSRPATRGVCKAHREDGRDGGPGRRKAVVTRSDTVQVARRELELVCKKKPLAANRQSRGPALTLDRVATVGPSVEEGA